MMFFKRRFWVLIHRYAGLYMAVFLIVAGLTGTILAYDKEINQWLIPEMTSVPVQNRPMLDEFTLREKALAPNSQISFMELNHAPGEVVSFLLQPKVNSATGKPYDLGCAMIYLNPYTGEETARLKSFDDWPVNRRNFIFFVFDLHSTLHLGQTGGLLFGIAALIWTIDCFVGFALTLPRPLPSAERGAGRQAPPRSSWLGRWVPSWKFVWKGKAFRINFSLHRAAGLWTWAMLFVFAISSVSFNLPQVYEPAMKRVFSVRDVWAGIPDLREPAPAPGLDWRQAAEIGQKLAAQQASLHGFKLRKSYGTTYFSYDPGKGVFSYAAHGERDVGYHTPAVTVYFDGKTGELRGSSFASGENAASTFTNWMAAIHGRTVGGWVMQFVVGVMGVVIAMLSVTGVYIWWVKRKAAVSLSRAGRRRTGAVIDSSPGSAQFAASCPKARP